MKSIVESDIVGTINIEQGTDSIETKNLGDNRSKMEGELVAIIGALKMPSDQFDDQECANVIEKLDRYVCAHKRILYSTISNQIFEIQKSDVTGRVVGYILSNLDALISMEADLDNHSSELRKIILKIWDHVNLAQQQYKVLHLSDQEYQEMFKRHMLVEKERLYHEINGHMVTMIGIFTALSFVIFGGINSIETAFSGIEDAPITKLMVIGCVWGFGLLNMVYIFLYCIAKLNDLNFKNHTSVNANFVQRYQFIVIPNLVIIGLLVLSLWLYFVSSNNLHEGFVNWFKGGSMCFVLVSIVIFVVLVRAVSNYISRKIASSEDDN